MRAGSLLRYANAETRLSSPRCDALGGGIYSSGPHACAVGHAAKVRPPILPAVPESHGTHQKPHAVPYVQNGEGERQSPQVPASVPARCSGGGHKVGERVAYHGQAQQSSSPTIKRTGKDRNRQRYDERRRGELTEAHLAGVLLHHAHLPVAVLEILSPEGSRGAARGIAGTDARAQPDPPPEL